MRRVLMATIVSGFLLAPTTIAHAQNKADSNREKQEVAKVVGQYQAALNSGDAKAAAALFTETGDHIGPKGRRIEGRKELERNYALFLETHKSFTVVMAITSVRLLDESHAIVDAEVEVEPAIAEIPAEPRSTLVLVRHDGRWLIESARDTLNYEPSNYRHLNPLEWLVGDWKNDPAAAGGASIRSNCDWADNRSFLIRKFSTTLRGQTAVSGTEVIGWDPREHQIRSWDFDSDGGYGQSSWNRDGNRWIIKRSGVQPDGSQISATHVVTLLDADTLLLQASDRLRNGEKQPGVDPTLVRRYSPQASPAALPPMRDKPEGKAKP